MDETELGIQQIGPWRVDFNSGICTPVETNDKLSETTAVRLEPKSCQLLALLVARQGQLVSKEEIIASVWPDSYASDDTLARTLSRLRASLGDDPRAPNLIETLPKRGYRLLATVNSVQPPPADVGQRQTGSRHVLFFGIAALTAVALLSLFWWWTPENSQPEPTADLLARADDYYHQMRLADNEMAIALYEQQIELTPDAAIAYAGLANSLVQRVVRWSDAEPGGQVTLTQRVSSGELASAEKQQQLQRARVLAEKAVSLAPENAATLKALGFVLSAQGNYAEAIIVYERALQADENAWQVWLNKAELHEALGATELALDAYQRAFTAMSARYTEHEVQIRPWYAEVGNLLGDKYLQRQDLQQAESWYRRVLTFAPLHEQATLGLAVVLQQTGDKAGALRLCEDLQQRLQASYDCEQAIAERK
ncbi:winged helix-turn-helix domain-containing protein [Pseudidiomarina insulisalsae]|uniref:OmpR/PhoB-type domain-containing protein n=1 Tax=Pseudidiomarina insulisalsae TaxID=575789 RepID=A0A432YQ75_9GAMM|nr:winged helix-turn-helix domain-containing protein [Pseudidiomarina insulisalsae]RUO63131.1 hypothetical protein CWI71_02600 [Pseudidiomarina insulisalsae]